MSKSIVYLLFSLLLISIFSQSAIRLSVFALPPPSPAGAITLNLGSTVYTHTSQFNTSLVLNYPAYGPGYKFWVYVDVINVTGLYVYGVGFNFSAQYLHLIQVQNGGFFPTPRFFMNESSYIDNVHGNLLTIGATDSNPAGHSGSGHLIRAEFNVTASPPYTGTFPGSPVPFITLTNKNTSLEQTQLLYNDIATDITPSQSHMYGGTFQLDVHPTPPTCNINPAGWVPVSPNIWNYTNGVEHFYAIASGGDDGYGGAWAIVNYYWSYGDGTYNVTATSSSTHKYAMPTPSRTYTVTLNVTNNDGQRSVNSTATLAVILTPPPTITVNVGSTVETHTSQFNTSLTLNHPPISAGYTFWVYVDVINITGLWEYGVGFNFSASYLHLIQVQNGGFFPTPMFFLNGSIDNVHGVQPTVAGIDSNPAGQSGSGHLIKAEFNVTASPPYTGAYPGSAVPLITLTTNNASLEQTQLIYNDTITDITPPMSQVYDGQFRLNLILHDLAVTNVTASGRVLVGQSIIVNVTIQNKGTCTETFNLTLYGETRQNRTWTILTLIGETLTPGSTKTLTIDVYLDEGTYTLIAYSWPVPGETHTSDNTCTSSTILVAPCPCIGRTFYRPPTPL